MASKILYTAVAVVGIAAASGAAWWVQNKPATRATASEAGAGANAGAAAGAGANGPSAGASSAPGGPARPPAVEVSRVEVVQLTDDAQAVGTLRSRQSVLLRPEVSGRVVAINFRDGQRVRRGQVLVQLDDQLPRAQVQQAQAELSIAQANHKRNQELVAQNFISQRSVEESGANLQVAQAKLALAQATASRLRIVAPFDGIAGIGSINVGDYLKDGADIVNIEDMEAIQVDYRLPERYQTKLRTGQSAVVVIDALPGRKYTGVVQAIDPLVDADGRSVGIRACIDNRHLQLRPGMFARITAVFGTRADARVVPEEAIVPQAGRQFVLKLVDGPDQDTKIAQRVEVKLGLREPGRVEVTEGLQAGDVVVVAGQQRVQRDGSPVRVVEVNRSNGGGAAGAGGARQGGANGAAAQNGASVAPPAAAGAPTTGASGTANAAGSPAAVPMAAGVGTRAGPAAGASTVAAMPAVLPAAKAGGPDPCVAMAGPAPRAASRPAARS
jgi:membrane fusion protein (multidrug efflux system)